MAVVPIDGIDISRLTLTPAEQAHGDAITHPGRRAEWLAWHALLRRMLGEGVSADYDASGAPVLIGAPGCISVAHSRRLVALYHRAERCGIDIEALSRDFSRTADRFLSPAERSLARQLSPSISPSLSSDSFPALAWCAKEAVYKYAGRPGLDLLRDIRLARLDPAEQNIHAVLLEKEAVTLRYSFIKDHCLVYTV